MAPHIFVEDITISGVEAAREAFLTGRLRERLARHHRDPDSAFWGWNRIWLDPQFRSWSIEDQIVGIDCPILAMQGLQDGYATMAQLQGIKLRLPQTWLLEIPDCGHSPHRAHPDLVCRAIQEFVVASLS
jgi:pimeloyl-ACP methyl ester carboxylesterase